MVKEEALFAGVSRIQVLSLDNVNAVLHWILIDCVDEETAHHFGLVVQLAEEAFLAISRHP